LRHHHALHPVHHALGQHYSARDLP
jgi:hypothetical protein